MKRSAFSLFIIPALLFSHSLAADVKPESLTAGWTEIFPAGDTSCTNGSPYSFHVKPGAADRVMIFFNGGGACWSGDSCDINTEPTNYSPLASIAHNDPKTRGGAFDLDRPENPFRQWSQVFVSYCTGDVHLGARDMLYTKSDGAEITIRHRGKANSQAVLDWVYKSFESPDRIFISGGSAGGVASPYYATVLADHYTDAQILHFAGGSGAYRLPPQTLLLENWGVLNELPAWPELAGYNAETLHFDDLYLVAAARHPGIRFHQFNGAYDWAQQLFLRLLGSEEFVYPLLVANLADLKKALPHFSSYTVAGEFHTILRFDEMYQFETAGVRVVDWIRDIASGKPVADVSCGAAQFCQAPDKGPHHADFTNPHKSN